MASLVLAGMVFVSYQAHNKYKNFRLRKSNKPKKYKKIHKFIKFYNSKVTKSNATAYSPEVYTDSIKQRKSNSILTDNPPSYSDSFQDKKIIPIQS